jgi:hypothetical protein
MELLWQLGWTDGRNGQPSKTNESIIDSYTELKYLEEYAAEEQKLHQAEARVKYLQSLCGRIKAKLDQLQSLHDELWQTVSKRVSDHSLLLAIIYLLVAIMLILADIPLSLTLVARGFQLKTEVLDPNTGEITSVNDLLTAPFVTITRLWEPLIMSIGIALSGVFIKYFLDEVLFRERTQATEPAKRFFRDVVFIRKTVLWVLFLGFISTIVILGFFRADIQRQERLYQLRTQTMVDGRTRGLTDQEIERNYEFQKQEMLDRDSWAEWAFISLTLMFPLVSGICFSAGWSRLEKTQPYIGPRLRFGATKRSLSRLEKRYDKAFEELTRADEDFKAQTNKMERERNVFKKRELLIKLQNGIYVHGYERGQTVPDTLDAGLSSYEQIEKAARKIMAQDMRDHIWQHRGEEKGQES